MSQSHLKDLRRALERKGWSIVAVHEGDGYRISAFWELHRNAAVAVLDFNGFDDLNVRPLNRAYGVVLLGRVGGLCFSRIGLKGSGRRQRWMNNLTTFVESLEG